MTESEFSPAVLRDAIAESLSSISAYDVAHACDSFGLPEVHDGSDPWNSKYKYVRKRLFGVPPPELRTIAERIIDEYDDQKLIPLVRSDGLRGVDGELKNLIFAANGPKPRIVLRDAINNVIEIVDHAESCLVYDRPLSTHGLSWGDLVGWWSETTGDQTDPGHNLYRRLRASLDNAAENAVFHAYGSLYGQDEGDRLPALIPQVYLHYDPYTLRELSAGEGAVLKRQRMDFLLLFSDRSRVVVEVDGKQHYADGDTASPRRYAEMVAEDRRLRLAGYEVYRFGGAELDPDDPQTGPRLRAFLEALFERHQVSA